MNLSDTRSMILWIITLFTVAPISFYLGSFFEYKAMTEEAIKNHVGEWVIDSTTGAVDFKWRDKTIWISNGEIKLLEKNNE